jgi:hypothetical protein
MKRKRDSLGDLIRTVACVDHSDLKDEHRHFLSTIAPFADKDSGRRVHPGFEYISTVMRKSQETVRRYARHCEELGLIEIVKKPDGKGIATEWRICLEHPAFPDTYPTYKPDSESVDLKSVRSTNPVPKAAIGPHLGPQPSDEKAGLGPHLNCGPIKDFTSTPPSTPSSAKLLLKVMKTSFTKQENQPLIVKRKYEEQLTAILAEYSYARVEAAWYAFLKRGAWSAGWREHLMLFINEFESHLATAETKQHDGTISPEVMEATRAAAQIAVAAVFSKTAVDPNPEPEDDGTPDF